MTAALFPATTAEVELRIYGEPQPQGSKTGFVNPRTGRMVMTEGRRPEAREAFKDWRGGVSAAAKQWQAERGGVAPIDAPVTVDVTFWLTKGSSLPKWRWLPWSRPDIDKLARAVLDGITGTLIRDDGWWSSTSARSSPWARRLAVGCG